MCGLGSYMAWGIDQERHLSSGSLIPDSSPRAWEGRVVSQTAMEDLTSGPKTLLAGELLQ